METKLNFKDIEDIDPLELEHKPSDNWQLMDQTQKGNIGEDIVCSHLEQKGYTIKKEYLNNTGIHVIDGYAYKDGELMFIFDVKTKPLRNKYKDSGFNKKSYENYIELSNKNNVPCYIFFVDEIKGEIYGNSINNLKRKIHVGKKQYPSTEQTASGEIIFFPFYNMNWIKDLTKTEIKAIKKWQTRNEIYNENYYGHENKTN